MQSFNLDAIFLKIFWFKSNKLTYGKIWSILSTLWQILINDKGSIKLE